MITYLLISFLLFVLRGIADYLTQADAWHWRLPKWYNRERNIWIKKDGNIPNWLLQIIPFRDQFHLWQFIRNRAHTLGAVLILTPILIKYYNKIELNMFITLILMFLIVEILWVVTHGAAFNLLKKYYNDKGKKNV